MDDIDHSEVTKIKTKKSRNQDHLMSTKPENLNDETMRGGTEQQEQAQLPRKTHLSSIELIKDKMKENPNLNFSQQKGNGESDLDEDQPS